MAKIKLGAERVPNTSGPENHCERSSRGNGLDEGLLTPVEYSNGAVQPS